MHFWLSILFNLHKNVESDQRYACHPSNLRDLHQVVEVLVGKFGCFAECTAYHSPKHPDYYTCEANQYTIAYSIAREVPAGTNDLRNTNAQTACQNLLVLVKHSWHARIWSSNKSLNSINCGALDSSCLHMSFKLLPCVENTDEIWPGLSDCPKVLNRGCLVDTTNIHVFINATSSQ